MRERDVTGAWSPTSAARSGRAPRRLLPAALLLVAGCAASTPSSPSSSGGSGIDAARCAANRSAGTITYLTGFGYGGSVGILDVLTAQARGYYRDLCLNVTVRPGSTNAQLVSANTAQLGSVGGPSDAITAAANGAAIVGVATYGNTSAVEAVTMAGGPIRTLKDFQGVTFGYKGAMPPQLLAMLRAGGVDLGKLKTVSVGFDPRILPQGRVQALSVYKSNEPLTLRAKGYAIREWDPAAYGIKSAFNTVIANRGWAAGHPTAVEDFLRATFHGFAYTDAHLQSSVEYAARLAGNGYDVAANTRQWRTESKLVRETLPAGHGIGWQTVAQWQPEYRTLQQFHLVRKPVALASLVDNRYVAAIDTGSALRWPATAGTGSASP